MTYSCYCSLSDRNVLVVVIISERVPSSATWMAVRPCATRSTLMVVNATFWSTQLVSYNPLHCEMDLNIYNSKKILFYMKIGHYHPPPTITNNLIECRKKCNSDKSCIGYVFQWWETVMHANVKFHFAKFLVSSAFYSLNVKPYYIS